MDMQKGRTKKLPETAGRASLYGDDAFDAISGEKASPPKAAQKAAGALLRKNGNISPAAKPDCTTARRLARKQRRTRAFKTALIVLAGCIVSGMCVAGLFVWNWLQDTPLLDTALVSELSQSSIIYDKNGKQVTTYSGYENREWVDIEDIPQWIRDGIVSTEDKRFYEHGGVDTKRFLSAVAGQLTGSDHGGSTLTQQLIKNVYLTSEVTYKRKVQEIYLAFQLEKQMSKDEILEAYLNVIYLGGSNYGVKAASRDYFGKELDELSLMECALIAGLTQNPNGYNPRANKEKGDMEPTVSRTEIVLQCMLDNGKITQAEHDEAVGDLSHIEVAKETSHPDMYPYPHYVEYVLDEVAEDLLKKEGAEITADNLMIKKYAIRNGGYRIYTALDTSVQKILQEEAENFDAWPQTEDENEVQVSAVVIEPSTGGIAGMIGSRHVPKAQETYNRAVDSTQPVGSSMKPVAIYAAALEAGAGTGTPAADYPAPVMGYDLANNYPGGVSSYSPMSMRRAIETSNNIPAAHFLCDWVGIEKSAGYLVQMGISGSHISHTGSGIALGTSDVTTLEMAGAYATLANQGTYIEPHAYVSVVNSKDEEVLSSKDAGTSRQVYSEQTVWMMDDMLMGNIRHGGGTAANFDNNREIAGKSGTHEDRCITFGGYTAQYASFVRMSCDSYAGMKQAGGGTQTAALWNRYMGRIHENAEALPLRSKSAEQTGIVQVEICTVSGNLAGDLCKEMGTTASEYYKQGTEPSQECEMHAGICTQTHRLASEECIAEGLYVTATCVPGSSYLGLVPQELLEDSLDGYSAGAAAEKCTVRHARERQEKEAEEERRRQEEEEKEKEEKEREEQERRRQEEEERQAREEDERARQEQQEEDEPENPVEEAPDGQEGIPVPDPEEENED